MNSNCSCPYADFLEPAEDEEAEGEAKGEGCKEHEEEPVPDSALAPELQVILLKITVITRRYSRQDAGALPVNVFNQVTMQLSSYHTVR